MTIETGAKEGKFPENHAGTHAKGISEFGLYREIVFLFNRKFWEKIKFWCTHPENYVRLISGSFEN